MVLSAAAHERGRTIGLVTHDEQYTRRRWDRRQGSFPPSLGLAAIAAGLLVVLGTVAVRVHSLAGPLNVDSWVSRRLTEPLPLGGLELGRSGYNWIARVGAPGFVALTMLLVLGFALRRRDYRGGLLAVVGPGIAFAVAESLAKPLVGRLDPVGRNWSFPSGTVTVVAAAAAVVVVLVYRWAGPLTATAIALALVSVPIVVAVAVVELRWHYATDTIAGLALGAAVVCTITAGLGALEGTAFRPRLHELRS